MSASNTGLHLSPADQQEEASYCFITRSTFQCEYLLASVPRYHERTLCYSLPPVQTGLGTWLLAAWNGILALPLGRYLTSQTSDSTGKILTSACFGCSNQRIPAACRDVCYFSYHHYCSESCSPLLWAASQTFPSIYTSGNLLPDSSP